MRTFNRQYIILATSRIVLAFWLWECNIKNPHLSENYPQKQKDTFFPICPWNIQDWDRLYHLKIVQFLV